MLTQNDYHVTHAENGFSVGVVKTRCAVSPLTKVGSSVGQFDSLMDYYSYLTRFCAVPLQTKQSSTVRGDWDRFYHFNNYQEALATFYNKPESLIKFNAADEAILSQLSSGNETAYDVTGDFIDMDRYLEGSPEVFGTMINGNPHNIFADVNINSCYNAFTSTTEVIKTAERTLRLIDWLETEGIRVGSRAFGYSTIDMLEVALKSYDETLNLANFAVALNPDFLRRLRSRFAEYSTTWSRGYGSACSVDDKTVLPRQHGGISIYVEVHVGVQNIERRFDALERKIKVNLENGDQNFLLVL